MLSEQGLLVLALVRVIGTVVVLLVMIKMFGPTINNLIRGHQVDVAQALHDLFDGDRHGRDYSTFGGAQSGFAGAALESFLGIFPEFVEPFRP